MTRTPALALCTLVVLAWARPGAAAQAEAPIYRDIVVDGDLSDWPGSLPEHRIANVPAAYRGARVDGPEDLSGSFRVAYDPDADIIYLAVRVRDDELVTGNDHLSTDACEVYLHPGLTGMRFGPLQSVLIPGPGAYEYGSNPMIASGLQVGQAAFTRSGDITTYEWALRFAGDAATTDLAPGRRLGFDVVLVDKDGTGPPAWVPWGNMATSKTAGVDRVGRLLLTDEEVGGSLLASLGAWLAGAAGVTGWLALACLAVAAGAAGGFLGQRTRSGGAADRRLAEIECRLTDIQDVVIALAERSERRRDSVETSGS